MRRPFLPTLFVLISLASAGSVGAQTGAICIYQDTGGTVCPLTDSGPASLVTYHVVQTLTAGTSALQFSAPKPACMDGQYLSDSSAWPVTIGNSQTGVSVAFGGCQSATVHVLSVNYLMGGSTPNGCAYPVAPFPGESYIEVVDCNNKTSLINGGTSYFGVASCDCAEDLAPPILDVSETIVVLTSSHNVGTVNIENVGGLPLNWSVATNYAWLSFNPTSGTDDTDLTLTAADTGLPSGTYQGGISITSNGGNTTVTVYFNVENNNPPVLSVSPTLLAFGTSTTALPLTIANLGGSTLLWAINETIDWFTPGLVSGSGGVVVSCAVTRTLPPGTYEETFTISSNGGSETVTARMEVPVPVPVLSHTNLPRFAVGDDQETFQISNIGDGDLNWTITPSQSWISALPAAGTNSSLITVTVDRTGLADGTYNEELSITSNGGNATILVVVDVFTSPVLSVTPSSLVYPLGVDRLFLELANTGVGVLNFTVAPSETWVTATPASGTVEPPYNLNVAIDVDRSTLADGTHLANVVISSDGGDATIPVSVEVSTAPVLAVHPSSLLFHESLLQRTLSLSNIGLGVLSWTVTPSQPWIGVNPQGGTEDESVIVTIDPVLAPTSNTDASVTVNSNGGDESVLIQWRPVPTQPGQIGVFEDANGVNQCISDVIGVKSVYVVHVNTAGSAASQFAAPLPACWTGAIYLADSGNFGVTLGNSQTGVAIGYGACLSGPAHILTIQYFAQGMIGQQCCAYQVLPDPSVPSGQVVTVDCASHLVVAAGLTSYVSPNAWCGCGTVKTEQSTWGQIKSMYANPPAPNGHR